MFSLHSISHVSELETHVSQKTELLFENQAESGFGDDPELIDQLAQNAAWVNKTIINDNAELSDKLSRRFLFLSTFLLNQWLSTGAFQHKLSVLTAAGNPTSAVRSQFTSCFLSSHIMHDVVQYSIDSKSYGSDKKELKSIQRL